ncbi:MAG: GMP synthase [Bacteroidota bacterium]
MSKIKLAILDLYDNTPNQGMRAIRDIVSGFAHDLDWQIFDVRGKAEVPNAEDFDIYISSGGPGDPLEGDGEWDEKYFDLIDALWFNNQDENRPKKYVFFICHSFQMACHHFGIGKVTERRTGSFGTFPVHKTKAGKAERFFVKLDDPFYAADFRDYQVIQPNPKRLKELGAEVLALEKIRPHVNLERAIMAVRFSEAFFGTQFHPEADPEGMLVHFQKPEKMRYIIEKYGEEKFEQIIDDLNDPEKIKRTYQAVLPGFLIDSMQALKHVYAS